MDITDVWCPNPECPNYGIRNVLGHIVSYGSYGKHSCLLLRCRTCRTRFSERKQTVFYGLHTDEKTIERVVRCLVEGNGLRASARIMDLSRDAVSHIFWQASRHCKKVLRYLFREKRSI